MSTITIQGLSKSFGANTILKDIDLDLGTSGITAVIGPNGSGKTTLIKIILGLVLPDKGDIRVDGVSIAGGWTYRSQMSYLSQIAHFPANLTVRELLNVLIDLRHQPNRSAELIKLFELHPHLDKKMGKLSGGTIQKVNLVCALMFDTPVLFLDEPTTGLDPLSLQTFKRLLKAEKACGKLIILTTHILGLVEELADEIVYLLEGHVHYRGAPRNLMASMDERTLEDALVRLIAAAPLNGAVRDNGVALSSLPVKKKDHV